MLRLATLLAILVLLISGCNSPPEPTPLVPAATPERIHIEWADRTDWGECWPADTDPCLATGVQHDAFVTLDSVTGDLWVNVTWTGDAEILELLVRPSFQQTGAWEPIAAEGPSPLRMHLETVPRTSFVVEVNMGQHPVAPGITSDQTVAPQWFNATISYLGEKSTETYAR